jgi:hypothetical protein
MIRFRKTEQYESISNAIKNVLEDYFINLIRADENEFLPQLWDNVEARMDARASSE